MRELQKRDPGSLLRLKNLGPSSMRKIDRFFELGNLLCSGNLVFASFEALLAEFLKPDERFVLAERYGLSDPEEGPKASNRVSTLQSIASRQNLTRERVRQIEAGAMRRLREELPRWCFQPLLQAAEDFIRRSGEVVHASQCPRGVILQLPAPPHPAALLRFCADLTPDSFRAYHRVFSTLDLHELEVMEKTLLQQLSAFERPVEPTELEKNVSRKQNIRALLTEHPEVVELADGTFCYTRESLAFVVTNLLRTLPAPAHFRDITRTFNETVKPHCQRGAGFVLRILNNAPDIKKTGSGYYAPSPGPRRLF